MTLLTTANISPWRLSTAPMMEWSDRHCRYFWRLMTHKTRLYTEMVTTGAILQGYRERFLGFDPAEHPVALQLGGSDPKALAACAKIAEEWGFDEVNLNCGCPSDRVQNNRIGAILMAYPQQVADCIKAMQDNCSIKVTVKNRIGIDDMDDDEGLQTFIDTVAATGCDTFIVHARKAWLKGLSPKENREVPPLNYDRVISLKKAMPNLTVCINGGINSLQQAQVLLDSVDGVMIGREAYHNPYLLAESDQVIFNSKEPIIERMAVAEAYIDYIEKQLTVEGVRLNHMTRHMLGLFQGLPGARLFRRHLSENATKPGANVEVVREALKAITYQQDHHDTSSTSVTHG